MPGKNISQYIKKRLPQVAEGIRKLKAKKWPKDSIVFYVGDRKLPLTPNSLQEGASGSYTAVIYLSKEWAKLGRQVTIYSPCEGYEGIYEGVEYRSYYYFNPYDTFDILIILQHPYLLKKSINARKICLEWQDVLGGERIYPRETLKRFDIIFAKSQYQRSLMPFITDDKFVIVTNGVDKSIGSLSNTPKKPYKLVYASRYYRGLEMMLTYGWPIIKAAIPEAELDIYYGWTMRDNVPENAAWKERMIALMEQEGVCDRGMVGQDKLIAEKAIATIHYYACTYEEIDCISVRESAMVGCIPVTTTCGVMAEKQYCVKIPGEPKEPATQKAVAEKIVELLRDPPQLAQLRKQFKNLAKDESWDVIANVWLKNFDR